MEARWSQNIFTILLLVGLAVQTRAECGGADVVFVLDKSKSLGYNNWLAQIAFVHDVIDALPVGTGPNQTRVGSVSYSRWATVDFHLNQYSTAGDLKAAFSSIYYDAGWTNTADGLALARTTSFQPENGDREGVPDVCVLLTDGDPNVNVERTPGEVQALEDRGVHVLVVVVGTQVKVDGIVGSSTAPQVFVTEDFSTLRSFASNLTSLVCETDERVATTEIPEDPCPTMVHIAHAYTVTSETSGGEVAMRIHCDEGYQFPDGARTRNATGSQYWTVAEQASQDGCHGNVHPFIVISCQDPPSIGNSSHQWNSTSFASATKYTCNLGYMFMDGSVSKKAICLANKNWSIDKEFSCKEVKCPPIRPDWDKSVNSSATSYGTVVRVLCNQGYQGDIITTCDVSGNWDPPIAECLLTEVSGKPVRWPPSEAEGAEAVAGVVVGISAIIVASILLLDILYFMKGGK